MVVDGRQLTVHSVKKHENDEKICVYTKYGAAALVQNHIIYYCL